MTLDMFDQAAADELARLKVRPAKEVPLSLQEKFEEFHAANSHVYDLLVRYARQARATGRAKLGIKCLFERVRWYANIETGGETFKLNNNHAPFYARLIEQNEADLHGFFEMREQRSGDA